MFKLLLDNTPTFWKVIPVMVTPAVAGAVKAYLPTVICPAPAMADPVGLPAALDTRSEVVVFVITAGDEGVKVITGSIKLTNKRVFGPQYPVDGEIPFSVWNFFRPAFVRLPKKPVFFSASRVALLIKSS